METQAQAATDMSIVAEIVAKFKSLTDQWMGTAIEYAKKLFFWCLVLEIAYLGIRAALGASEIGETFKNFVMVVLAAGFFLAVINNYQEWSWNLINGLNAIASEMGTVSGVNSEDITSDNPFKVGFSLASGLWDKASSVWDPGLIIIIFITSLIVLICFALITAQVILIKCEAMVALLAACILLGLGASKFFREYAINVMRYVVSVAFKLFVMQLVLGLGFTFIASIKSSENVNFSEITVAICVSIILLALVKSLPDVVAGIINGSHVGSGGALLQTAAAVGAVAGGAAMAGMAGASVLKNANAVATAEGKSGMGRMKSIGSTVMDAMKSSRQDKASKSNTIGSKVQEQLDAMKFKE